MTNYKIANYKIGGGRVRRALLRWNRINSLFAYNVAKLNMLRAIGRVEQGLQDWLKLP